MKLLHGIFKNRRLQVHILTIFTALLAVSTMVNARFTYKKYYSDINDLALTMIAETDSRFYEKMSTIKDQAQLVADILKGSLQTQAEMTGQDKDYEKFLLNILRSDPILTTIMIAAVEGDYYTVADLRLENIATFYSTSSVALPEDSQYGIRAVRRNGNSFQETRTYLNEDGVVLSSEVITPVSYDFQQDPWFQKMLKTPKLFWAKELLPRGSTPPGFKKTFGVTLSDVVRDSDNEVAAVFSLGITLKSLSDFVRNQKVAENGFALILNEKGDIVIPTRYGSSEIEIFRKELEKAAYLQFETTKKSEFILDWKGKEYLVSIRDSVVFSEGKALLAIVVPFEDFLGSLLETALQIRIMAVLAFLFCGLIIYIFSKQISNPIVLLSKEVDQIREFNFSSIPPIRSSIKEILDLEQAINAMRVTLRSFGRYVPKEIVRMLIKCGEDVHLGGERREITIMFSDVKDFTSISESLSIEELMKILSEYFDVLSKIVLQEGGTIDKYIGDSLMAFWGAPLKMEDHAEKACLTCLQCLAAIQGQKKWTTRFGIHTGEVIVGNIGTSERINYTVIGDAVNVASRLEGINKEYQTFIMISEGVREKIGDEFITRPIDFVAVKGKTNKLKIFELMGTRRGPFSASLEQVELSRLFTEAYASFEEGRLREAKASFLAIEKKFPEDKPTKKYLERLNAV